MRVVHPAYQALPKGGHGTLVAPGVFDKRWLSWVLVFANSAGYVMAGEVRQRGSGFSVHPIDLQRPFNASGALTTAVLSPPHTN